MWNAIKSDLFDFIGTIQADTANTLIKVLGEDDDKAESNETSLLDKLRADVRRSFETYGKPIQAHRLKDYERFKKKFSLSTYAQEIAQILDEEVEVPRYYAELVPVQISPEIFWSRLFFRLYLLSKNGTANFEEEDDEEEELVWEDEAENEQVQEQEEEEGEEEEEEEAKPKNTNTESSIPVKKSINATTNETTTTVKTTTSTENTATSGALPPNTKIAPSILMDQASQSSNDDYSLINAPPVSPTQQLSKLQQLEEENARLKKEVDNLKKRIGELEAQLELDSWGEGEEED